MRIIIAVLFIASSLHAFGQWTPKAKKVEMPKPAVSTAKPTTPHPVTMPKPHVDAPAPKQ